MNQKDRRTPENVNLDKSWFSCRSNGIDFIFFWLEIILNYNIHEYEGSNINTDRATRFIAIEGARKQSQKYWKHNHPRFK